MRFHAWRDDAACADSDPDLFDTDRADLWRMGQAICAGCPVIAECLADAMESEHGDHAHRGGVRGGLTPRQRWRLARRRGPGPANDDQLIVPRQSMPPQCLACGRPMRRERVHVADAPGTVKHHGRGLCTTCWRVDTGERRAS